jgi:SAM-dependent methyltransferase
MNAHAETVQERFSREAGNWNDLYDETPTQSIYTHNVRRRKAQALDLLSGTKGRVLEIGCGAGNVILSAPEGLGTIGLDFSLDMLRQAKANSLEKDIDFLAADALSLPFADGSFGAVICLGLFDYITDYRSVLEGCHSILKPGGRLIVSVPNVTSPFVRIDDLGFSLKNTITHSLPDTLRTWLKTRIFGKDDKPYFTHRKQRYNPAVFTDNLKSIGFEIDQTHYHTYGFGLLNGISLNLKVSRQIESRNRSKTLEKLGWTYILKATKSPQQ